MFIFTAKLNKRRLLTGIAAIAALAITAAAGLHLAGDAAETMGQKEELVMDSADTEEAAEALQPDAQEEKKNVSTLALTNKERMDYLAACGWEVDAGSCTIQEVIIPSEFDEIYQSYAELQARQGFDIEKLKGKRVKQITYTVTNYPEEGDILAELLVYRGNVVAGDICSMKTDGGFTRGLMDHPQAAGKTEDTSASTNTEGDGTEK